MDAKLVKAKMEAQNPASPSGEAGAAASPGAGAGSVDAGVTPLAAKVAIGEYRKEQFWKQLAVASGVETGPYSALAGWEIPAESQTHAETFRACLISLLLHVDAVVAGGGAVPEHLVRALNQACDKTSVGGQIVSAVFNRLRAARLRADEKADVPAPSANRSAMAASRAKGAALVVGGYLKTLATNVYKDHKGKIITAAALAAAGSAYLLWKHWYAKAPQGAVEGKAVDKVLGHIKVLKNTLSLGVLLNSGFDNAVDFLRGADTFTMVVGAAFGGAEVAGLSEVFKTLWVAVGEKYSDIFGFGYSDYLDQKKGEFETELTEKEVQVAALQWHKDQLNGLTSSWDVLVKVNTPMGRAYLARFADPNVLDEALFKKAESEWMVNVAREYVGEWATNVLGRGHTRKIVAVAAVAWVCYQLYLIRERSARAQQYRLKRQLAKLKNGEEGKHHGRANRGAGRKHPGAHKLRKAIGDLVDYEQFRDRRNMAEERGIDLNVWGSYMRIPAWDVDDIAPYALSGAKPGDAVFAFLQEHNDFNLSSADMDELAEDADDDVDWYAVSGGDEGGEAKVAKTRPGVKRGVVLCQLHRDALSGELPKDADARKVAEELRGAFKTDRQNRTSTQWGAINQFWKRVHECSHCKTKTFPDTPAGLKEHKEWMVSLTNTPPTGKVEARVLEGALVKRAEHTSVGPDVKQASPGSDFFRGLAADGIPPASYLGAPPAAGAGAGAPSDGRGESAGPLPALPITVKGQYVVSVGVSPMGAALGVADAKDSLVPVGHCIVVGGRIFIPHHLFERNKVEHVEIEGRIYSRANDSRLQDHITKDYVMLPNDHKLEACTRTAYRPGLIAVAPAKFMNAGPSTGMSPAEGMHNATTAEGYSGCAVLQPFPLGNPTEWRVVGMHQRGLMSRTWMGTAMPNGFITMDALLGN